MRRIGSWRCHFALARLRNLTRGQSRPSPQRKTQRKIQRSHRRTVQKKPPAMKRGPKMNNRSLLCASKRCVALAALVACGISVAVADDAAQKKRLYESNAKEVAEPGFLDRTTTS